MVISQQRGGTSTKIYGLNIVVNIIFTKTYLPTQALNEYVNILKDSRRIKCTVITFLLAKGNMNIYTTHPTCFFKKYKYSVYTKLTVEKYEYIIRNKKFT